MEVTDVENTDAYKGEVMVGTVHLTDGGRRLFLHDVAHAFKCLLDSGASHKMHAGCIFNDVGDGIAMDHGYGSKLVRYDEAREFINNWYND